MSLVLLLQVDPVKPKQDDAILNTEDNTILDESMSFADFTTLFLRTKEKRLVNLILASTKSKTWQVMERGEGEYYEDTQQCHVYSQQPKFTVRQHRCFTRSKDREKNEAETNKEATNSVYLRDDGEKNTPV